MWFLLLKISNGFSLTRRHFKKWPMKLYEISRLLKTIYNPARWCRDYPLLNTLLYIPLTCTLSPIDSNFICDVYYVGQKKPYWSQAKIVFLYQRFFAGYCHRQVGYWHACPLSQSSHVWPTIDTLWSPSCGVDHSASSIKGRGTTVKNIFSKISQWEYRKPLI